MKKCWFIYSKSFFKYLNLIAVNKIKKKEKYLKEMKILINLLLRDIYNIKEKEKYETNKCINNKEYKYIKENILIIRKKLFTM